MNIKRSLSVDIGNTQISVGLFENGSLIKKSNHLTKSFNPGLFTIEMAKLCESSTIVDGLISSVVPALTNYIQSSIEKATGISLPILSNNDNNIVKLDVDNPSEVGGDLLADLVAAKSIYGYPCLIIDLGTLTKNLVIDGKGSFSWASFHPGVKVSLEVMSEKAALIPNLEGMASSNNAFGKNTIDAMNSGVYFEVVSTIEALSKYAKNEFGDNIKIILTGGYSSLVKDHFKSYIFDEDLALKGIQILKNIRR